MTQTNTESPSWQQVLPFAYWQRCGWGLEQGTSAKKCIQWSERKQRAAYTRGAGFLYMLAEPKTTTMSDNEGRVVKKKNSFYRSLRPGLMSSSVFEELFFFLPSAWFAADAGETFLGDDGLDPESNQKKTSLMNFKAHANIQSEILSKRQKWPLLQTSKFSCHTQKYHRNKLRASKSIKAQQVWYRWATTPVG